EISKMRDVLTHRGPDNAGLWVQGRVGLGHRRLSIIDLSERGRQPMSNETGTVFMVFNGEIYNFQELRQHLEKSGHRFYSQADSEVIIHAYEEYGVECLDKLRGMFAFALWDVDQQRLFAARDRLGKKPFFYCRRNGDFYFASEIKAMLALPQIPREVNFEALGYYLSLNYTPAPHTLFKGIQQLEPAQYLLWRAHEQQLQIREYWDLSYPPAIKTQNPDRVVPEFEAQLQEAIRYRLIADVPVGAFLSGGLDSATIVALAAPLYPGRLKTFSIGFAEKSYDERPYARQVASRYRTEHHELVVTPQVKELLPTLVWHAEEPTADSSMVPVYYLAEFAAREVKVVLTGDGADEILAGYETYQAHYLLRLLNSLPTAWQKLLQRLVTRLPVSDRKVSLDFKLKRLVAALGCDADYAHYSWRQIWSPEAQQDLLPQLHLPEASLLYRYWFERSQAGHPIDRMLYADTRFYLPNDMLVKVDRMTMAHALEARTPFLDHGLVETAAGIPAHWKLKGLFLKKYLLRRLLQDRVPAAIRWQGKKGFNVPVGLWIKTELKDYFADTLEILRDTGWINMAFLRKIFQQHVEDRLDYSHQLWGLLILALWWQTFIRDNIDAGPGLTIKHWDSNDGH
ncbi:MAG: asparagine synthase (glutamine-hydrolyzing), partial [Deltaproteobacteria bacterium]|nr:asparagine synthase (glutamine-hydrolyzing) [Deltaproteobacteria bacterium]